MGRGSSHKIKQIHYGRTTSAHGPGRHSSPLVGMTAPLFLPSAAFYYTLPTQTKALDKNITRVLPGTPRKKPCRHGRPVHRHARLRHGLAPPRNRVQPRIKKERDTEAIQPVSLLYPASRMTNIPPSTSGISGKGETPALSSYFNFPFGLPDVHEKSKQTTLLLRKLTLF